MHFPIFRFCCFALVCFGLLAPAMVAAQGFGPVIRPYRHLDMQWQMQQRQLYRPNVHVVRASGESRNLKAGSTRTLEFTVMRGYVSRIEIRSGQRVIRTLPLSGPARNGQLTFTLPTGLRDFKLWAWQGQPGNQSVHGESVKYSLIP